MLPSKWENLSRCSTKSIDFWKKNYHLHWGLQTEQILSVNIQYTYFFNFGRGFCSSFSVLFPKPPLCLIKKKLNNFCCIALLFEWAQKPYLRFLKSYFKLEILIFFRGVFYSRYVQLNKSSFSEGKNISGDI